jgi:hypothetical protein
MISIVKVLERDAKVIPIVGIKTEYLPLPKNQGAAGLCWAFAAIAHLEIEYAVLTGNRMKLSVEQVDNNIVEFYNNVYNLITYRRNPLFEVCCKTINETYKPANGGYTACALMYYLDAGVMLEHDYPYNNGDSTSKYNISKTTHLNIDEIQEVGSFNGTILMVNTTRALVDDTIVPMATNGLYEFVYSILEANHSVSVSIHADNALALGGVVSDKNESTSTNHAAVLTAFTHIDATGDIYAEVFNSWGDACMAGGLYYIKVYDAATNEYWNNRVIFTRITMATVSSGVHKKPINSIELTIQFISFAINFAINFVIIAYFLRPHFGCFKRVFDSCCCYCRYLYREFCNNKLYREEQESSSFCI